MANEFRTWPVLGDFHPNIKKELLRRKNQTFGEDNKPRAVWVRAVSNAVRVTSQTRKVGNSGVTETGHFPEEIRKDINIMVGGLLRPSGATRGGFEPVYQRVAKGRELLDRPMPGIESISVASKGEYGSLRKITINWVCPSVEDLDILMPYWLTPGISVMVEWGWSNIGQIPVGVNFEDDVAMAELYRYPAEVMKKVVLKGDNRAYAGNQDFFIGIITNWTWNMNEDGSFTCTTELTTFGETMLALNLNKDVKNQGTTKKDDKKVYGIREFTEKAFSQENLGKQIDSLDDKRHLVKVEDVEGTTSVSFFGSLLSPTITHIPDTEGDVFMSWEFIEKKIINKHGCPIVNGDPKFFAFEMDSSQTKVSNDGDFLYSRSSDVLINNNNNATMIPFPTPPDDYNKDLFGEIDPLKDGFLKNVYLKRSLVVDSFNTSETLEEAVMKMMNKVRNSLFDLWDLKIQTNALGESKSHIIDQKYVSRKSLADVGMLMSNKDDEAKNNEIFNFGGYSGESILRNVGFTSKMTNQVALTYFFGKNKDKEKSQNMVYSADSDSGVTSVYGNTVDRVLRNLRFEPDVALEEKTDEAAEEESNVRGRDLESDDAGGVFWRDGKKPNKDERYFYRNENDIKLVDEYLRQRTKKNEQKLIPIYPLEISVTIDGISGILPGNVFTLDNLPKMYKDSGVFQVVEIAHEITSDDWTTTLRAFFRPVNTYDNSGEKSSTPITPAQENEDSTSDEGFTENEPIT